MQYLISFLEGIITFVSPCLLPMLPVYLSYFAGGGEHSTRKTLTGAFGFVTGFTVVFVLLGALAGTVGSFLQQYQDGLSTWCPASSSSYFGLNFLGVIKLTPVQGNQPHGPGRQYELLFGAFCSASSSRWGGPPAWGRSWARPWRWPPSRGMCWKVCCCS